jgi:hypothetical protein
MFPITPTPTLPAALCVLLGGALVSCGKPDQLEANKPVVTPTPEVKRAAEKPNLDAELLAALAPAPGEVAGETAGELEAEAQRVMDLYPEKNAQELLNVPEVNPKLVLALKDLAADPQLQAAINKSVDLAAHFKGLTGAPGAYKLNLDVKAYDGPRTQRMLTAVLAGQAKPMVQFLVDELGEASFEFSFTDAEKTTNGISLEPNPAAAPAATTPADPD